MEPGVTASSRRPGFMLVWVMIITGVGLLLGAGALLTFRTQCQQRLDRQHELEKLYAVRSALNYIRNPAFDIGPEEGVKSFRFRTGSERDLGLLVKPADLLFPVFPTRHLYMEKGEFAISSADNRAQYNAVRDYEFGALGTTNALTDLQIGTTNYNALTGISFRDVTATNGVRWWVNVGMRGTGGWLQSEYGRRYMFKLGNYVGTGSSSATKDIVRLCIVRDVSNECSTVKAGMRHGWPLSQEGERALVLTVTPVCRGSEGESADMQLVEYEYRNGALNVIREHAAMTNCASQCYMGLQLAGRMASVFYISKGSLNENEGDQRYFGCTHSKAMEMDESTCEYFRDGISLVDNSGRSNFYAGIVTNRVTGEVHAPDLRAVLEVEAHSDVRGESASIIRNDFDFLTNLTVMPAYQYSVLLEYPGGTTNRATVAQKVGKYAYGSLFSVFTYDTHGTENKGFRKDEREQRSR